MARLIGAGNPDGLGDINTTQGEFRGQIDVVADSLLQLAGNADVGSGVDLNDLDPLNAPFVLYVNPYIGRDTFVAGSYNTLDDDGTANEELRRIEQQRLTCGYTEARPFRTINRAIIEAGIITSKDYWNATGIEQMQLVSIILAPGMHTALNGQGNDTVNNANFPDWVSGDAPTDDVLTRFNPAEGGIILPRGVSLCSLDLRKCSIAPAFVPVAAAEALDLSNRTSIFRVTGQGYYFGFTIRDNPTIATSHHLLSAFEFASEARLNTFYSKINQAITSVAGSNLDAASLVARPNESQIVGPVPEVPVEAVDTVNGASPYIYNISLRSQFGMCGVLADGSQVTGNRSMVIAQFTGVSLQRDMSCWETFAGGTWTAGPTYNDYIAAAPNDTRMRTDRRSFHIRCVNSAVIQEVSVFAIGQGIHHWVQSAGELTITNSNSNYGGVAALAEGYRGAELTGNDADNSAFPQDRGWAVNAIRRATDLSEETNNVRRIFLGEISAGVLDGATNIDLEAAIGDANDPNNEPNLLARDNYSTRPNSRVWIENPVGDDYSSTFAAVGWSGGDTNRLVVTAGFTTPGGDEPDGTADRPNIAGLRVYVRRVRDTRSVDERSYSLQLGNTGAGARTPLRDYITQVTTANAGISNVIPVNESTAVLASAPRPSGGNAGADVQLLRSNSTETYAATTFYRPGDRALFNGKHWQAVRTGTLPQPVANSEFWQEMYVHMEQDYRPEDYFKNSHPIIVFDNDIDPQEDSTDLGYDFDNATATDRSWFDDPLIRDQLRTGTDYRGLHRFLMSIGFTADNAHRILIPAPVATRSHNPADGAINGSGNPTGGVATGWAQWPLNFRRPSTVRLFGHAYEWAGYLNYTKAVPRYQGELSPANKFTYYGTNEDGGKVYFSGFNEEGFSVSPRGVEDTQTGEILGLEEIGSVDREIQTVTSFPQLSVDQLTVDQLTANTILGDITWGNANTPLDGTWTRQGTDVPPASGPLPRIPAAQTPPTDPPTAAEILQTPGITRYTTEGEVDAVWTAANEATPPATAGVATAAITPASLYSMVQDIVAAITAAGAAGPTTVPPGMVGYFAANAAPNINDPNGATDPLPAWLYCDGAALNTFTHRRLHAAISNTFGGTAFAAGTTDQPGATTTFNLPELRGQFVRGWNNQPSAGLDEGRAFGSAQDDQMEQHNHTYQQWSLQVTAGGGGPGGAGNTSGANTGNFPAAVTDDDETRPVNVALLPMIKT